MDYGPTRAGQWADRFTAEHKAHQLALSELDKARMLLDEYRALSNRLLEFLDEKGYLGQWQKE